MVFDPHGDRPPEAIADSVEETIEENHLVVFMKGTPRQPECGYSQRAIGLILRHTKDIMPVNVLTAPEVYREALVERSGRRTIPQTFVDGEFVGGSDILGQLEARDELEATLTG